MELLGGGQLLGLLQREAFLPERHCAFYAAEVALALQHLHAHGVVHRRAQHTAPAARATPLPPAAAC